MCLGAAPGQVAVGDSTTVLLYKLMRAAVAARPGRTEIVIDRDHFPTDRYVAMGVAEECGMTLRWVDVDTAAGLTAEQVAEVVGEQTALVVVNHVSYRSAWLADVAAITRVAHDAGALVLLDMCHSAGVVPSELDAWGVDLAAGCTYKYLNGGPGLAGVLLRRRAPPRHVHPADPGLDGQHRPVPDGARTTCPCEGIRRFLSGTPAVVGMLAIQDMVALIEEAGLDAVRKKSEQLTAHAVELAEEHLAAYDVRWRRRATRRAAAATSPCTTRGCGRSSPTLWERDVIPDYRDPGGLRIGLSPLSTSYDELERGMLAVARGAGRDWTRLTARLGSGAGWGHDTPATTLSFAEVEAAGLTDWRQLFEALHTRFTTGDFATGLALVTRIGALAEEANHHPDVDLRYPHVNVTLFSHDVFGVTSRDVDLARAISAAAAELGVAADPTATAVVEIALDTWDHEEIKPFWRAVLGLEDSPASDQELLRPVGVAADAVVPAHRPRTTSRGSASTSTSGCRPRWPRSASPRRSRPAGCWSATSRRRAFTVLADAQGNKACVTTGLGPRLSATCP